MDRNHKTDRPEKMPLPPSRRRLFRILGITLPVVGMIVVELGLRVFGWGGHAPLLQELAKTSDSRLMVVDPDSTRSYFFANREGIGGNARFVFRLPKPTNTFRVFLFGGSAIKGFPQPRHLAPSAFLEVMLRDVYPNRTIEAINFGTTAVASFPVRDMLEQSLDSEPDLVVIYSGHNEFYGAYGAASSHHAGRHPWMQVWHRRVHSLALVQVLQRLTGPSRRGAPSDLMQVMVGQDHIPADDWRRAAAKRTLTHNIGRMIQASQRHGIPVIVCTLPSNERDLAPIGREATPILETTSPLELFNLLNRTRNEGTEAVAKLEERLLQHLAAHPESARAHHALGRLLYGDGRTNEASAHFIQARDLDSMPWRATSSLQQSLREVVASHDAQLCDVEQVFRQHSPGRTIGQELMDDHVHPTERGQALIAEALVRCMTNVSLRIGLEDIELERLQSWEAYAHELGASDYDRYTVHRWMRIVFDIPFMKESNPQSYNHFVKLTSDFEADQPVDVRMALQRWDTRLPINVAIAGLFVRQGRYDEALPLLRSARYTVSPWSAAYMEAVYNELGCLAQLQGDLDEGSRRRALKEIEQGKLLIRSGAPDAWIIERTVGRLYLLREEYADAIPHLLAVRPRVTGRNRVLDDRALIRAYSELGDFDRARALALDGVASGGPFAKVYLELLSQIPTESEADNSPKP